MMPAGAPSAREALQLFDLILFNWLTGFHAPWLDTLMSAISASGSAGMIWLVLAALGLRYPLSRAAAWRVVLSVIVAGVLVDRVVKPLFGRERPVVAATEPARYLPPVPPTYSFPSGHAATTFSAVVAVNRMWPQRRVVWWTLALLMGYSRIYLGHHYPLDVLGGAVIGMVVAFWVLGGRHAATYSSTLPTLPDGVVVKP